jgi:hypothetical protein
MHDIQTAAGAFLNLSVNGCLSLSMKLQPTVDCIRLRDSYRPYHAFLPIGSEENIRDIIVALQEQSKLEASVANSSFSDVVRTRESRHGTADSKPRYGLNAADSTISQGSFLVSKKPDASARPKGRLWDFLSHSLPTVTLQDIAQTLEEPIDEVLIFKWDDSDMCVR